MTFSKKKTAVLATAISTAFLLSGNEALTSLRLEEALEGVPSSEEVNTEPEEEIKEVENPKWKGKNLSQVEQDVLSFLQDRGIRDRSALATVMGNIKQESLFNTNICEGGVETGYSGCHSGGFGLIQWTTTGRYNGLGSFSRSLDLIPIASKHNFVGW